MKSVKNPSAVANQNRRAPPGTAGHRPKGGRVVGRSGASTLDFVLILVAILPIVAWLVSRGIRMMQLIYEMICVLVAWPFL